MIFGIYSWQIVNQLLEFKHRLNIANISRPAPRGFWGWRIIMSNNNIVVAVTLPTDYSMGRGGVPVNILCWMPTKSGVRESAKHPTMAKRYPELYQKIHDATHKPGMGGFIRITTGFGWLEVLGVEDHDPIPEELFLVVGCFSGSWVVYKAFTSKAKAKVCVSHNTSCVDFLWVQKASKYEECPS